MSMAIRNLCKAFAGQTVLDGFSCVLPDSGVVALMGSSGAGKSTLINLLLGLIQPDSGSMEHLAGKRFSAVFQEDRLMEQLSAMDNLRLTCGRTDDEISAALVALRLDPDEKKPVRSYSGGMKRRVALARGVLYRADILLLDEPFRGLDAQARELAVEWILREWKGRLIILVTHDAEEARMMGASETIILGGNEHGRTGLSEENRN